MTVIVGLKREDVAVAGRGESPAEERVPDGGVVAVQPAEYVVRGIGRVNLPVRWNGGARDRGA